MDTDKVDTTSESVRDMDAPSHGGGNGVGRSSGDGDLRHSPSEHLCKIYPNKAHYGPVTGGGMAPRSLGLEAVVVTGRTKHIGDTRGGSGIRGG